ncbi:MAG: TraR/DksA family transcriptional regulator [Saprospiraceae bacterium]
MENNSNAINRYSDEELLEFKNLIDQKIAGSKNQLRSMVDRIENISESTGNDGDWMDDSSNLQDLDMLNSMIGRQRKHIQDLENALIRIHNKRFGICIVTGQLIDKRRLMAVPTTSKSLEAKTTIPEKIAREEAAKKKKIVTSKAPASFSRVIKRTGGVPTVKPAVERDDYFDDEDEDENDLDEDLDETENFDLDSIVDESTSIDD